MLFFIRSKQSIHLIQLWFRRDLDLGIRQIAGRVRRPDIAGDRFGPNPEITGTDVEPAALGAAPFHMPLLLLQFAHEIVGQIGPDFGKWPLSDIAEAEMAPELVGVDLTVPADATNASAGVVTFIHL